MSHVCCKGYCAVYIASRALSYETTSFATVRLQRVFPLTPHHVVRTPPRILDAPETDIKFTSSHQPFVSAHSKDAAPSPRHLKRGHQRVERAARREPRQGSRLVPFDQYSR